MTPIDLKRPEVADKYIANVEKDIVVHAKGYSGKLSNINLAGAAHVVSTKLGFLKEKDAKASDPAGGKKEKSNANRNGVE